MDILYEIKNSINNASSRGGSILILDPRNSPNPPPESSTNSVNCGRRIGNQDGGEGNQINFVLHSSPSSHDRIKIASEEFKVWHLIIDGFINQGPLPRLHFSFDSNELTQIANSLKFNKIATFLSD